MAKASLIFSISLATLLLFNGCLARQQSQPSQDQNQCDIRGISALETSDRIQAEAGYTEFWDSNNQKFQCAGVQLIRHIIRQRGLLLPSYVNAPLLVYIEQGRGIQGVMLSGCPETFQSSQQQSEQDEITPYTSAHGSDNRPQDTTTQIPKEAAQLARETTNNERSELLGVMLSGCPETFQSSQQQSEQGSQGQRFQDRHQKIYHFRQGDVLAIPAGAAHWLYNDGDSELVAVVMLDINNDANQLDQNRRRFFLAGNPQSGQQQPRRQEGKQGQQQRSGNIFNGFDVQVIAEAFNVDKDTAKRLQGQDDQRGHIVNVERGLQVIRPPQSREEQEREEEQQRSRGLQNGLEETVCTTKLRENIDDPSRADFYNPQAGRSTTLNSNKFPILRMLQLSAERGVLHRNAMVAPHWTLNAHNIMYVTRGSARLQIVNNQGQAVFNDEVRQGQVVVVPQNFAVIKRAGEQGCRWIKFRTNDNAMINTLAGRTSAFRAMPVDVIANAYQITREQAQNLKYNREETVLFSPSSRSERSVA